MVKMTIKHKQNNKVRRGWDDGKKTYKILLSHVEKELLSSTLNVQLPVGYLSPSSINMYLRCPLQFYYRYVLKKIIPPNVYLIEGGCHHGTLEYNNKHKRKRGYDLKNKLVIEHFMDNFSSKRSDIKDWKGENESRVLMRGKEMQTNYMNDFAPLFIPKIIEKKIQINLGKIPIMFITDVIGRKSKNFISDENADMVLMDYKTKGKLMSVAEIEGSIQLGINKMGIDAATDNKKMSVGFCVLKKTGNNDVVWQPIKNANRIVKWAKTLTIMVAKSISLGSFPPCDPSSWICSPKWCGYWYLCRGKKQ